MQKERLVVTGAGGFLGSHISRYFSMLGHKVFEFRRPNSLDESSDGIYHMSLPDESFIDIIRNLHPTVLIHCAGSSSIADSIYDPYNDFQETVGLTAFVLDTIRQTAQECKIITLSSAAVYGNPLILPVPESSICSPISPYGVHKLMSEKMIVEYSRLYGIPYTILRVFSAYGAGLRKQVMYDMCKKLTDSTTDHVEVIGTGLESRDFIHVKDICRAIEWTMKPNITGTFNLGSGQQTTVYELVELIKNYFNSTKAVKFTGKTRSGDPLNWEADITEITKLGFTTSLPLQSGLREYCNWYEKEFSVV
jgi:UDP-glucose 4-epimerase